MLSLFQISLKFTFHLIIVFQKEMQILALYYIFSKDNYEAGTKPHWNADAAQLDKPDC